MKQQYHDGTPQVIKPLGGWEPHTWYLVDVEVFDGNPRHRSLFFSGFTKGPGGNGDGTPGNYNGVQSINSAGMEDSIPIKRVKYLRVVRRLFSQAECEAKEPVVFAESQPTPPKSEKPCCAPFHFDGVHAPDCEKPESSGE